MRAACFLHNAQGTVRLEGLYWTLQPVTHLDLRLNYILCGFSRKIYVPRQQGRHVKKYWYVRIESRMIDK